MRNNRDVENQGGNLNSPVGILVNQNEKSMEHEEEDGAVLTIMDSKRRKMTDGPNNQLGLPQQKEQMMIDDIGQVSKNLFEAGPGSQARRAL